VRLARLDQSASGDAKRGGAGLAASASAVRPAARLSVHVAECGVCPTQVAEWAGHSVDVLLRIYAKCVVGQDELAKRRISEALRQG
jgi:hypothetical protein